MSMKQGSDGRVDQVTLVLAPAAPPLLRFAAAELRRYLEELFAIPVAETAAPHPAATTPRIVLGLVTDSHVRSALGACPPLSDQGFCLRRVNPETLVLAGGSPVAAAWAVYELVEHWGVRYLLHGDVYPTGRPLRFRLPRLDTVREPIQRWRCWRLFCTLPTGPAVWSLAQQRRFMDQLLKLRFNAVLLGVFPSYPAVDYGVDGIQRRSGSILQGQRFPLGSSRGGPEGERFLGNPDLPPSASFAEAHTVFRVFLHTIIGYARERGFRITLAFNPFEFPLEFSPLLQSPTDRSIQLGALTCAEQGDLFQPRHVALVRAKFAAFLADYGVVDKFLIGFPEHPQAHSHFAEAWAALNRKHGFEPDLTASDLLERCRTERPLAAEPERAERTTKSCVAMLHFYERLFTETDVQDQLTAHEVELAYGMGMYGACQALPLMARILPAGTHLMVGDYTTAGLVRKLHYLKAVDTERLAPAVVVTLQDDNIGWFPQSAILNIHTLLDCTSDYGWIGFLTRFWPIGDLGPATAYLAKASWDKQITPAAAGADHAVHMYGAAAARPFRHAMRLLEDAQNLLEICEQGLLFPVLGVMAPHMRAQTPLEPAMEQVRAIYEETRCLLEQAAAENERPDTGADLDYWLSRLDFAIAVINEIRLLREGSMLLNCAGWEDLGQAARADHIRTAQARFKAALATGEAGVAAAAARIRDDSDHGSVIAYSHLLIREVRDFTRQALADACQTADVPLSYPESEKEATT